MDPFLKIGVTSACFHNLGTVPWSNEELKKIVNGIANSSLSSFSILGYILSGPGDLFGFKALSLSLTAEVVTLMSVKNTFSDFSPGLKLGILVKVSQWIHLRRIHLKYWILSCHR